MAIGVTLLDFAADSCDSPLRAYIIDTCNSEDNDLGFNIHAFLGGAGSAVGYLITSIHWDETVFGKFIDENTLIFLIVSFVYLLSLLSTMIASKEKQVKLPKGIFSHLIIDFTIMTN